MSIVTVSTNNEDYIYAECYSSTNCVLAKAIHRATGDHAWLVEQNILRHPIKDIYIEPTPDWFKDLAKDFDECDRDSTGENYLDADDIADGATLEECFELYMDHVTFTLDTDTGEMELIKREGQIFLPDIAKLRIKAGLIEREIG